MNLGNGSDCGLTLITRRKVNDGKDGCTMIKVIGQTLNHVFMNFDGFVDSEHQYIQQMKIPKFSTFWKIDEIFNDCEHIL